MPSAINSRSVIGGRNSARESPHFVGKRLSSFRHQNVIDCKPSPLYRLSGLKKPCLALLDSEVSLE
jgi:hypothetical protein